MAKQKAGLHKEITSIFDGVPIARSTGVQQAPDAPVAAPGSHEQRFKQGDGHFERPVSPRQAVPTPREPKAAKYGPTEQKLPRIVPAEQPRADAATQNAIRIPWRGTLERLKNKLFAPKEGVNAGRQKTMTVLVPALLIIFVFLFVKVLLPSAGKTQGIVDLGPSNAAAGSGTKVDWQVPAPYPTTLRDPMRFSSVATNQSETETGELTVRGIVHSQDKPSAIVGNEIVYEGDKVSGATVTKINKDSVEFEKNGKRWTQKVK